MPTAGASSPCRGTAVDDRGTGAGRSLYAGLRVTLIDPQTGARPILTISVKDRAWGWDNWTLAAPATRPDNFPPVRSTEEALRALVTQLEALLEDVDES